MKIIRNILIASLVVFIYCVSTNATEASSNGKIENKLPPLPQGKKFRLAWHDEFDGTELDESKWNVADGPRRDGFWRPEAVRLDGEGHLEILTFKKGDEYIDGEIDTQGKFEPTFGYFVARVQLQESGGHWSAFWFMGDKVGRVGDKGEDGTEIDIYEKIDQSDIVLHNLHWDAYCDLFCTAGKKAEVPGVNDGFHTFSVLWTPKEYVFYVDERETWRTNAGGVCKEPLYLLFSDEIGKWAGDIKDAELPDKFVVDYVRAYEIVDE